MIGSIRIPRSMTEMIRVNNTKNSSIVCGHGKVLVRGDKQNSMHSIDNHHLVCCEEHCWNRLAAAATSDLRIAHHVLSCNLLPSPPPPTLHLSPLTASNPQHHANLNSGNHLHVRTAASQPFLFKKFTEV